MFLPAAREAPTPNRGKSSTQNVYPEPLRSPYSDVLTSPTVTPEKPFRPRDCLAHGRLGRSAGSALPRGWRGVAQLRCTSPPLRRRRRNRRGRGRPLPPGWRDLCAARHRLCRCNQRQADWPRRRRPVDLLARLARSMVGLFFVAVAIGRYVQAADGHQLQ